MTASPVLGLLESVQQLEGNGQDSFDCWTLTPADQRLVMTKRALLHEGFRWGDGLRYTGLILRTGIPRLTPCPASQCPLAKPPRRPSTGSATGSSTTTPSSGG